MTSPLLQLDNLSKYYTGKNSVVMGLNGVSLSFSRGEFVAITGESGSGKSTLAHVLGGILPYESGEMLYGGKPTSHFDSIDYERYRRENISFISQNYGILAGCTVLENVVSALLLTGMTKADSAKKAKQLLTEVELWEFRGRRAAKLSSGQKQRLSIARALAKPAPVLIADEPTGNLDPENSAKVIHLLAHAARERLVLLITHEFSEAEAFVTRHITIADGKVVSDLPVKPVEDVTEATPEASKKSRHLSFWFARLQIRSRPVWSALVLLFFALTAFAVFAFLGTFLVNLDDTPTRIYDDSAFPNGKLTRIVTARTDGQPMTEADYTAILQTPYVNAVERYGYLADVQYAWQEGIDFTYDYGRDVVGDQHDQTVNMTATVKIKDSADYLKTVPLTNGDSFLKEGRLPENISEVVAAGSEDLIGKSFQVHIQDKKNWGVTARVKLDVQIVGVTDYGSGLYFHDDLGKSVMTFLYYPEYCYLLLPNESVPDTHVRPSILLYNRLASRGQDRLSLLDIQNPAVFDNLRNWDNYLDLILYPEDSGEIRVNNHPYILCVEVSLNIFDRYTVKENCDQVSVTISDYAYTDRVLEQLHQKGYMAVSPFREGSTKVNPKLSQQRMQTLLVCMLAFIAIAVLQILVLRALFTAQTESYKLLSNMGLSWHTARGSVFWQVTLFALLGQGITLGAVLLCDHLKVERIVHLLRYLPRHLMVLLSIVHFLVCFFTAWMIARGVRKQVYPLVRKFADLEEVAE